MSKSFLLIWRSGLYWMAFFLLLSKIVNAQTSLQSVGGGAAIAIRESINQLCNMPPGTLFDENYTCPSSAQTELVQLAQSRDQAIVHAYQGYLGELPLEARTLLHQRCSALANNEDALFTCHSNNLGEVMWNAHFMNLSLPRNVTWEDCAVGSSGPLRGIARNRVRTAAHRDLCQIFSLHLKQAQSALGNYKGQSLIKGGVGIACMLARREGRITASGSGEDRVLSYDGVQSQTCFPPVPPEAYNVPTPYAPTAQRLFPEQEGEGALESDMMSSQTGIWPSRAGYTGVCAIGFNWAQDGMDRSDAAMRREVCPWLNQQEPTAGFQPELFQIMSRIEANDYFELLRLEAVARTVRAARVQLGDIPALRNMPAACGPVAASYGRSLTSSLTPQELQLQALNTNSDYPQAVQSAARRIKNVLAVEARDLESELSSVRLAQAGIAMGSVDDHHSPTVYQQNQEMLQELRQRQEAIQRRLNEIQEQILADFERYPVLMVGRDHDESLWESNPKVDALATAGNLASAYARAKAELATATLSQIGDVCNPEKVSDIQLARDPNLSSIVLAKFPRFQSLHQCVMDQVESSERTARVLRIGAALGCIAFGPIGGAVCGGLIALGGGYMDYERAQTRLSYEGQCRMSMGASNAMCSSQDYLAAREEYNDTIRNIAIDGALEILLPVAGASLKFLSAARIRGFKTALEGATTENDIRRIAREMEEAAEEARRLAPTNATPSIPTRVEVPAVAEVPPSIVTRVEAPVPVNATPLVDDILATRGAVTRPARISSASARQANVANVDVPSASTSQVTRAARPGGAIVPNPGRTLRAEPGSIRAGSVLDDSMVIRIPEINYVGSANPVDDAQAFMNSAAFRDKYPVMQDVTVTLDASTELGRGGTRRVFSLAGDNSYVAKVYDQSMSGLSGLPADQAQEIIKAMIQRELALEDMLVQVADNYRRAGIEPPFKIARIVRDPDLLERGIILQERHTGQTMDTISRTQLDQLSPPPSGYNPPATNTVTYRGRERTVDEFGEFTTKGGLSHRELERLPGVSAYKEFIDAYDTRIREVIGDRLGVGVSTRGGPDMTRIMGMDVGNGYGNVMLDPDGPGGAAQVVIYDW